MDNVVMLTHIGIRNFSSYSHTLSLMLSRFLLTLKEHRRTHMVKLPLKNIDIRLLELSVRQGGLCLFVLKLILGLC